MVRSWLLLLLIITIGIIGADQNPKNHSIRNINVFMTEQKLLARFGQSGKVKQLELLIIENFAKKFNFKVKFSNTNTSLSVILSTRENLNKFSDLDLLR